jgi:hypothetical protein
MRLFSNKLPSLLPSLAGFIAGLFLGLLWIGFHQLPNDSQTIMWYALIQLVFVATTRFRSNPIFALSFPVVVALIMVWI